MDEQGQPEPAAQEPVVLSEKDAREAARLLALLLRSKAVLPSQPPAHHPRDLAARVRVSRQLRSKFFSPALTGEPAYEMLLALYTAEDSSIPMSLKQVIRHAEVAPTTAIRWLDYLCDQDLIEKLSNPNDRRVVLVRITAKAENLLDAYFTEIVQKGLVA